jgi:hypothetical protein
LDVVAVHQDFIGLADALRRLIRTMPATDRLTRLGVAALTQSDNSEPRNAGEGRVEP